jgi:glycerophosphoryl diester phosphodiesterase
MNASCSFPTDCDTLERLQPCDCVVYSLETPGMCQIGRLLVVARVGFHDVILWLLVVAAFLVALLATRIIRLERYRLTYVRLADARSISADKGFVNCGFFFFFFFYLSDDSSIPVSPVYGWPMAILPTNPSKQVAHAGHRIRALLGLFAFFANIVFVIVGRASLLVESTPDRTPVSGFAITAIVCGIGSQLSTAGVLSVWQSLYFSRYDVYGRAPPNFFAFAYAVFPLRKLPTLARWLPRWLATRMTRRFVHVLHVCVVLAYTLPVIFTCGSLIAIYLNVPLDHHHRLRHIEGAASTVEGFFALFQTLALAWNIDFGLALIWNRHIGVAGGEGRRGVFGTALAQRQDLHVALATALQIINSSQIIRVVTGTCPYSEALNNGDAYIQSISDVCHFAFYCVFAIALIDCVVPRSLLVSVEDTFAFTLVDRRRSAPPVALRALTGGRAAHAAVSLLDLPTQPNGRRGSGQKLAGSSSPTSSTSSTSAPAPLSKLNDDVDAAAAEERPTMLRRVSSRLGFSRDDDESDSRAAFFVDWRRARPDVLVLREAGPAHDVPPFESHELVNASARCGEAIKSIIAVLLLIFRFTVEDRAFWQHLIVAGAFFLSLVSADSVRTSALVMRPWVRLYRRRAGLLPASGSAEPQPWRDAITSACATAIYVTLIVLWIYLVAERDPIELGLGTYVTVLVFFVVQSVLVIFFAPYQTNQRFEQVSKRVQDLIDRLTTHSMATSSGGSWSLSDIEQTDDLQWHSAVSGSDEDDDEDDDDFETISSEDATNEKATTMTTRRPSREPKMPVTHSHWRATLVAALESPTSTHLSWRLRWFFHDLLIVTMVAVGVLTAYTIFMQGLAFALLLVVMWLTSGAVARAAWEARVGVEASDAPGKPHTRVATNAAVFAVRVVACFLLVILLHAPYASEPRVVESEPPLIQGHRGVWTSEAAENSFAAVDVAVKAGWHVVEVDIRQSADKHLVVMHDSTVDRTANATGRVDAYTLRQLRAFKMLEGNETIHTLAEHLAYAKARGIAVFIDLKPAYAASFAGPKRDFRKQQRTNAVIDVSVVMRSLATACSLGMLERTMLSTAELHYLVPLAAVAPEYTFERDYIWYSNDVSFKLSPDRAFGISIEMLVFNPWLIRNAHRAGKRVVVFFLALETGATINYAIGMGADYLMLNSPANAAAAGLGPEQLVRPGRLPNADIVPLLCNMTGRSWQTMVPMNATDMPGPSRDIVSDSIAEWGYNWGIVNGSFPPTKEDEGFLRVARGAIQLVLVRSVARAGKHGVAASLIRQSEMMK